MRGKKQNKQEATKHKHCCAQSFQLAGKLQASFALQSINMIYPKTNSEIDLLIKENN